MAQSIQRGGKWWNERPDGVWLRWSGDTRSWEPQQGNPPPPGAPASPSSGDSTELASPFSALPGPDLAESFGSPATLASKGIPAPSVPEAIPVNQASEIARVLPELSTAKKANSAIFSEGRREVSSLRENKVLMGLIAAMVILVVFAGTYFGATMLFSKGSVVCSATPGSGDDRRADFREPESGCDSRKVNRRQGSNGEGPGAKASSALRLPDAPAYS